MRMQILIGDSWSLDSVCRKCNFHAFTYFHRIGGISSKSTKAKCGR